MSINPVYEIKTGSRASSIGLDNQSVHAGCQGSVKTYCLSRLKMISQHVIDDPKDNETLSDVIFLHQYEDKRITQQRNGSVKIWEKSDEKFELVKNISNNYVGFCSCQFSKELNLLVTPKNSSEISVIDCSNEDYSEMFSLNSDDSEQFKNINCIKLIQHDDINYLIAGFESGHLVMWNIKTRDLITSISFEIPISTFDYDAIDCRGFLGSPESTSELHSFAFNTTTQQLHKKPDQNIGYKSRNMETLHGVSCVRIRPDRKLMMVGTYDGVVYIHSMKSLKLLTTLRHHRQAITEIAYSMHEIKSMKSKITAIAGGDVISFWDVYNKS